MVNKLPAARKRQPAYAYAGGGQREALRNCLLFPFTLSLSKGRATELRQAQSERSQAMKIGKLFP